MENTHICKSDWLFRKKRMKTNPMGTTGRMVCSPYVKTRHVPPIFSASFALQLNTARHLGNITFLCACFPSLPFLKSFFLFGCLPFLSFFPSDWLYVATAALGGKYCHGLSIHWFSLLSFSSGGFLEEGNQHCG